MSSKSNLWSALVESVADDAALPWLAEQIAQLSDSATVHLTLETHDGASSVMEHGIDPDVIAAYEAHYWSRDLWALHFPWAEEPRIIRASDYIPEATFQASEIYNDLFRPNGDLFHCAGLVKTFEGGGRLVFGVHRSRHRGDYDDAVIARLDELGPMLVSLIVARRRRARATAQLASAALEISRIGVLVVSGDGRIHYANQAARRIIAAEGPVKVEDGRLSIPRLAGLSALLRRACAGLGGRREFLEDLSIRIDALQVDNLACVQLESTDARRQSGLANATARFGFTPAERLLAEALLRGVSPSEYAASRQLRLPTVRSQLQSLYAKAGVSGQRSLIVAITELGD